MVRYRGPKNRVARRFGANIFGRARSPLLRKSNPPGQQGARRRKKSDYGLQLNEKQKLKACYGMLTEKQLVKAFKIAVVSSANTANVFMERLECRLDNIVYRLCFAPTVFGAQQLVSHGHILVNGKKVDRRSFFVRPGMEIAVRQKSRSQKSIVRSLEQTSKLLPVYLDLDRKEFVGKLMLSPEVGQIEEQLPIPIDIPVVCEFLSHKL